MGSVSWNDGQVYPCWSEVEMALSIINSGFKSDLKFLLAKGNTPLYKIKNFLTKRAASSPLQFQSSLGTPIDGKRRYLGMF